MSDMRSNLDFIRTMIREDWRERQVRRDASIRGFRRSRTATCTSGTPSRSA